MCSEVIPSTNYGGNERALKYVIGTVDSLCDEISKASDSGKKLFHLELSTTKILDELEMSSVEQAKHEVALLVQLQKSLSRLIDRSEKLLPSPEMVQRLKKFREETQKLFINSPSKSWMKQIGRKSGIEVITPPALNVSEDQSSVAERTKTPSEEADRPDHDKERSDKFVVLPPSVLRKVQRLCSPEVSESMSDANAKSPKERSKQVTNAVPKKSQALSPPTSGSDNEKPMAIDEDDQAEEKASPLSEPTVLKLMLQGPPAPHVVKTVKRPQMNIVGEAVQEKVVERLENQVVAPSAGRKRKMMMVGVLVLPFVLVWLMVAILEGRTNVGMVGWQMACHVANMFCENYGSMCNNYCASGVQLEKWDRN